MPVTQIVGTLRQGYRLARQCLPIGTEQIVQQNTPGHPVHRQVMNHQQQSIRLLRRLHIKHTEQFPCFNVQALLGLFTQCGYRRIIRRLPPPQ